MKIELIKGDITKIKTAIIVNAANSSLMGGGGVDGAIHKAGGPSILEECKEIVDAQGECLTGEAVITHAGNLPADYVIHTVGPVWSGGNKNESELLSNCYKNSLHIAEQNNAKSIAFPNISTGVYGFPKKKAAEIAVKTVRDFRGSIDRCVFVCFDDENFSLYQNLLKK